MPELSPATALTPIDKAIFAKWAVPMTEESGDLSLIEEAAIGIHEGKIVFVGTQADFDSHFSTQNKIVRSGDHIIIPGLINMHAHMGMHFLKGKFDDYLLHDWLQRIWPNEAYWLRDENRERWIYTCTLLAAYESLLEGVTTVNDMYFDPKFTEKACSDAGLRVLACNGLLDFKDGKMDGQVKAEYEALKSGERSALCIHGLYTSEPSVHDLLSQWRVEFPDLPFHIHVNETMDETEMQENKYGELTVCQKLDQMGCLDHRTIGAHMVHITEDDIKLCGEKKVNVAHCPRSNMKLASGHCPTFKMVQAGMNVCMGTDSAVSNNGLSILDECTAACFNGKVSALRPDAITSHDTLRMATRNGAKALQMEKQIGTLEVGKEADVAVVDLNPGQFYFPITTDPVSHLIYTGRRTVSDTFRAGKHLVENGEVKSFHLDRAAMQKMMAEVDEQIKLNKGNLMKLQN